MILFDSTLNSWLLNGIAAALLHTFWQFLLIAGLLYFLLRTFFPSDANSRYLLCVVSLALCMVLPIFTFFYVTGSFSLSHNPTDKKEIMTTQGGPNSVISLSGPDSSASGPVWPETVSKYVDYSFYPPFFVGLWLFGMFLFSMRTAFGLSQIQYLRSTKTSRVPKWLDTRLLELSKQIGISRRVKIMRSGLINSPVVFGIIRPTILIPAGMLLQVNPMHLEAILKHELVHIKRFDYLVNLIQNVGEIVFFFNPCIWWISGEIRKEREFVCDDAVLQIFNASRIDYAASLADLEQTRQKLNSVSPEISLAANGGKLMDRIGRILSNETEKTGSTSPLWAVCVMGIFILAVTGTIFVASPISELRATETADRAAIPSTDFARGYLPQPERQTEAGVVSEGKKIRTTNVRDLPVPIPTPPAPTAQPPKPPTAPSPPSPPEPPRPAGAESPSPAIPPKAPRPDRAPKAPKPESDRKFPTPPKPPKPPTAGRLPLPPKPPILTAPGAEPPAVPSKPRQTGNW